VGRIPPELTQRITLRGRGLDFNSTDLGRGTPIRSELDPRWEGKRQKLSELRAVRARASELGWEICKLGEPSPGAAA
jgi:hypothetical protein